jgi:hypothetical protein
MDDEIGRRLDKIIDDAKKVIREALKRYKPEEIAITWTGGKDSTMVLWLFRQVCKEDGIDLPAVFSIDEFDHFDEVHDFIEDGEYKAVVQGLRWDEHPARAGFRMGRASGTLTMPTNWMTERSLSVTAITTGPFKWTGKARWSGNTPGG